MSSLQDEREKKAISFLLRKIEPIFVEENVTNIWVSKGKVSYKKFGGKRTLTDIELSYQECLAIITDLANYNKIQLDINKYPVLETTIPMWDARITAYLKWCKFPYITIRKRLNKIFRLDTYIEKGQLTIERAELIRKYIKLKKNIIIGGGTNSGKSTLATAILAEIVEEFKNDNETIFIIEDNPELQCEAEFAEFFTITSEQAFEVVKACMRGSPNRIIFGETRDGKTLWALLDAMKTGHEGSLTTLHCDSAEGAFTRMRTLLQQSFPKLNINLTEYVDLIIHIRESENKSLGVEIDSVIETKDYTDYQFESIAMDAIEQEGELYEN